MEGKEEKFAISHATRDDAAEIFDIINDAYSVETGDTGISFKNEQRLVDPLEDQLRQGYDNRTILKCTDISKNKIVGVLSYEYREEILYFGPFAVLSECKGQGIGKVLLRELKAIGLAHGSKYFQIRVVNHRTDLLPMYYRWVRRICSSLFVFEQINGLYVAQGFTKVGEQEYPHQERLTRPSHFEILNLEVHRLSV